MRLEMAEFAVTKLLGLVPIVNVPVPAPPFVVLGVPVRAPITTLFSVATTVPPDISIVEVGVVALPAATLTPTFKSVAAAPLFSTNVPPGSIVIAAESLRPPTVRSGVVIRLAPAPRKTR